MTEEVIQEAGSILNPLYQQHLERTYDLGAAAVWYAERGFKVFPLQPKTKIPFGQIRLTPDADLTASQGCRDATNDVEIIRFWWSKQPDANIGLATGHIVDVIDVDGELGQQSLRDHWEIFGTIERLGQSFTPRPAGTHIFVSAMGGGNKQGIKPGIDIRGDGGYVVAPPSYIEVGAHPAIKYTGRYSWLLPILGPTRPGCQRCYEPLDGCSVINGLNICTTCELNELQKAQ